MRYHPTVGIGILCAAVVADFLFGRTGFIFAAVLVVVYVWATGDR